MIRWIPIRKGNAFVVKHHRHHDKVVGAILCLGLFRGNELIGVAMIGRPSARHTDNGLVAEVTRLCVLDGQPNACSKLYGAAARMAKDMGLSKIITFILESESGISLKASGWILEETKCGGKKWTGKYSGKVRTDEHLDLFGSRKKYPNESKQRWVKILNAAHCPIELPTDAVSDTTGSEDSYVADNQNNQENREK
jgi:hypothetical protein